MKRAIGKFKASTKQGDLFYPPISSVNRKQLSELKIESPNEGAMYFKIPRQVALEVVSIVEDYQTKRPRQKSWRKSFNKEIEKMGEPALMLKGARVKEGMTQKQLADRLGKTQVYISQLENGRKEINKSLAKELEKIFGLNYKVFL